MLVSFPRKRSTGISIPGMKAFGSSASLPFGEIEVSGRFDSKTGFRTPQRCINTGQNIFEDIFYGHLGSRQTAQKHLCLLTGRGDRTERRGSSTGCLAGRLVLWGQDVSDMPASDHPKTHVSVSKMEPLQSVVNQRHLQNGPMLLRWLSGKESTCQAGDEGRILGLGRSPGEGNGNPLQYSCLGNPINRGTWWATVHGVAKSYGLMT